MNSPKKPKNSDRDIYILRYWRDRTLRGQIQHVQSGMTYPMRNPEELWAYIQNQLDEKKAINKPSGLK